jgi:hypothetical protein
MTKVLEDYFGKNSEVSAKGNSKFREQRRIYEGCKRRITNEPTSCSTTTASGAFNKNRRNYRYRLMLEERLRLTPDIIISQKKDVEEEKDVKEEGDVDDEDEQLRRRDTTFLLHATNGTSNTHLTRGYCNKRQFDFVELMYATKDGQGRTTFASEIARIMGIVRLTERMNDESTKKDKNHFLVLIAWMKDDDDKRVRRMRRANPLRYMKYNFDYIETVRGRRVSNLWLDLVTLQQIIQPVCAYHDPDLAPTYESESQILDKARFNVVTLAQTKKCYRAFRPIIGEGDPLTANIWDNQMQGGGEVGGVRVNEGAIIEDDVAMEWRAEGPEREKQHEVDNGSEDNSELDDFDD